MYINLTCFFLNKAFLSYCFVFKIVYSLKKMWFVIYYVWFYCANIAIFLQMVKDYTKEYNKKHCLFSLHYSHCEYFSKNRARQTIVGRWSPEGTEKVLSNIF